VDGLRELNCVLCGDFISSSDCVVVLIIPISDCLGVCCLSMRHILDIILLHLRRLRALMGLGAKRGCLQQAHMALKVRNKTWSSIRQAGKQHGIATQHRSHAQRRPFSLKARMPRMLRQRVGFLTLAAQITEPLFQLLNPHLQGAIGCL